MRQPVMHPSNPVTTMTVQDSFAARLIARPYRSARGPARRATPTSAGHRQDGPSLCLEHSSARAEESQDVKLVQEAPPSAAVPRRTLAKTFSRIVLRMAGQWTFLSNHGHVLVCLARDPDARMRDVADAVGVTERAVQQIVRDLVEQDYLRKEKVGRRNRYQVVRRAHFRHPLEAHVTLKDFVSLVTNSRAPLERHRGPASV